MNTKTKQFITSYSEYIKKEIEERDTTPIEEHAYIAFFADAHSLTDEELEKDKTWILEEFEDTYGFLPRSQDLRRMCLDILVSYLYNN